MINNVFSSTVNTGVKSGYTSESSKQTAPASPNTEAGATEEESATPEAKERVPGQQDVQAAVTKLNNYVQSIKRTLSFNFDESTGHTVIQVYDSETKELIREIPPEETVKLAAEIEARNAAVFLKGQKV